MSKGLWVWVGVFLVAAVGWRLWTDRPPADRQAALGKHTKVVALSEPPSGISWSSPSDHPEVSAALDGVDPAALLGALRDAEREGVWVRFSGEASYGPDVSLGEQLAAGYAPPGLRGEYLGSSGLLYLVDETKWPQPLSEKVLARVAREILTGKTPPRLDAFPEALARRQPVEVMVLLRDPRSVRLWRSARAPSIAEGLVTAALAAQKRWEERSEAMGGPLADHLDGLDVEVSLLIEDGTFESGATSLIDSLVLPRHGVAYQQPTRWRYRLPRATHGAASPTEAYRELFAENGLPEDSFTRGDTRLYRLRMQRLSIDQGSAAGSSRAPEGSASAASSSSSPGLEGSGAAGTSGTPGSKTTKVVPAP